MNFRMVIWVVGKVELIFLVGHETQKDIRTESTATILLACVPCVQILFGGR